MPFFSPDWSMLNRFDTLFDECQDEGANFSTEGYSHTHPLVLLAHRMLTLETADCSTDDHLQRMMNLVRARRCGNAHCSSQQQSVDTRTIFTRSVYQVEANVLCELVKRIELKRLSKSFGQLLYLASISQSESHRQLCSIRSCGYQERNVFVLTNLPDLVSVAIDWNSFDCTTSDVEDFVSTIDPLIHLRELFYDVTVSEARHQQLHLIGLVCFYGGTVEVFFSYDHQTCKWHFCFDGQVLVEADWNAVRRKCIDSQLQPFLLIYANPTRTPLDISQLLKQTVIQAKQSHVGADERRLKQAIVSNSTKTSMTKEKESAHSIEHLNKISSFANLTSSMLFLPSPSAGQPSYINQETVVKVMQQQLLKKEILSDTTSISSSSTSSPVVHVRHRSHLPPPPALEQEQRKQLAEDGSSSGDSTASSHRDSGLSSGMNDGSSDGSPRGSLIEHESTVMDTLSKQTQYLFANDHLDVSCAAIEREFETSLKFESVNNYPSALECCQRALFLVEQILRLSHHHEPGVSIYARTKKNSLLLRIRSLHQRQQEETPSRPSPPTTVSLTSTFKPAEKPPKKPENVYDNNLSRTISILSSTEKFSRPKKNVKFSDHVALIVPTSDDTDEPPTEHLIHSFLRKIHQQTSSDSDSDTPSSSNDHLPIGLTECSLCHKRSSKFNQIGNYCSNCHFYMQRFQPTAS